MKIYAPSSSLISGYNECTKTTSFSILGFFRPGVKLGLEFPGVLLNQKIQPCSLNFYFEEERHPILGSLKNFSSIKILNFPQRKIENARNQILLRQKDAPFNGELS